MRVFARIGTSKYLSNYVYNTQNYHLINFQLKIQAYYICVIQMRVFARARARAHVQLSIEICLKHSGLTYPKFIAYLASPFESYLAICILLAQNLPIATDS